MSSQNTRQMAKRTNGVKIVRTQQHYDLTDKRPITSRLKVLELLLSHKYHQREWNTHVAYQGDYLTDCWNVSNSSTFTQTPWSHLLMKYSTDSRVQTFKKKTTWPFSLAHNVRTFLSKSNLGNKTCYQRDLKAILIDINDHVTVNVL